MLAKAVAVHQQNGNGANASFPGSLQVPPGRHQVKWLEYLALSIHSLVNFNHLVIKHVRQLNFPGKDVRAILVANSQAVAKTPGHRQQGRLATTLKQGIGCHSGAHLHHRNLVKRPAIKQVMDTLHSGIPVMLAC